MWKVVSGETRFPSPLALTASFQINTQCKKIIVSALDGDRYKVMIGSLTPPQIPLLPLNLSAIQICHFLKESNHEAASGISALQRPSLGVLAVYGPAHYRSTLVLVSYRTMQ